jgi:hypothetical protein
METLPDADEAGDPIRDVHRSQLAAAGLLACSIVPPDSTSPRPSHARGGIEMKSGRSLRME